MVYNGEVFNYRELRAELTAAGYVFTTGTDTEVVLHAFAHWGHDCFNRFNGMWAIVIWDTQTHTLIASRDRFGIKPLYFAQVNGDWIFASEAKAILLYPGFVAAPDRDTVLHFILGQTTQNEESSFFTGIKHLKPATTMTIKDGVPVNSYFWQPPHEVGDTFRNVGEAAEALRALFKDAVNLRLRSDVRVGTMLSGGVDSTSIISTVKRLLDGDQHVRNVIGDRINAFTASFPGLRIDEVENVETLCQNLELAVHRVLPLELAAPDIDAILNHTIDHLEAPFHNAVPIVNTLLMRRARSVGVKVVLNGHGADEQFAGYPDRYFFIALADMITHFRFLAARSHFEGIHRMLGLGRKGILRRVSGLLLPRPEKHQRGMPSGGVFDLLQDEVRRWYQPLNSGNANTRILGKSRLDTALRLDMFRCLLPNWLQMEDRISMSESIESRLPFLDYRIVEFALSLDDLMKIRNGTTKLVLREAMKDRLPHSIATDPRKVMFSAPDTLWLRGPLRPRLEAVFFHDTPLLSTWLKLDRLRETVGSFLDNQWRPEVWRLFNTELFLRRYFGD